jgi:hypothetical protein
MGILQPILIEGKLFLETKKIIYLLVLSVSTLKKIHDL